MKQARAHIRALTLAINIIDGDYTRTARKVGLKENELSLLYALDDGLPHSQAEISRHWLIPKTTLNTIVQQSIARGHITLVGEAHSKQKQICLTQAGRAYARRALDAIYALEDAAYARAQERFGCEFVQALGYFAEQLHLETERFLQQSDAQPALQQEDTPL